MSKRSAIKHQRLVKQRDKARRKQEKAHEAGVRSAIAVDVVMEALRATLLQVAVVLAKHQAVPMDGLYPHEYKQNPDGKSVCWCGQTKRAKKHSEEAIDEFRNSDDFKKALKQCPICFTEGTCETFALLSPLAEKAERHINQRMSLYDEMRSAPIPEQPEPLGPAPEQL